MKRTNRPSERHPENRRGFASDAHAFRLAERPRTIQCQTEVRRPHLRDVNDLSAAFSATCDKKTPARRRTCRWTRAIPNAFRRLAICDRRRLRTCDAVRGKLDPKRGRCLPRRRDRARGGGQPHPGRPPLSLRSRRHEQTAVASRQSRRARLFRGPDGRGPRAPDRQLDRRRLAPDPGGGRPRERRRRVHRQHEPRTANAPQRGDRLRPDDIGPGVGADRRRGVRQSLRRHGTQAARPRAALGLRPPSSRARRELRLPALRPGGRAPHADRASRRRSRRAGASSNRR